MPQDHKPRFDRTVSEALRAAGYVALPRLWVRPHDIPKIHSIAGKYSRDVNRIRVSTRLDSQGDDPRTSKEAAWDAAEKQRVQTTK